MRLVILSTVLPLVLGVAGCAASGVDSPGLGSAPAEEEVAARSPEIKEKAAEIVASIEGVLKLNHTWNVRVRAGATTPEARRALEETERKLRATLATLPPAAEWVTSYVQENKDVVKAGFAEILASDLAKKHLGPEKIQALVAAVDHAGGVDEVILASTETVHDHARDVSEKIDQSHKVPFRFLCGMVGTIAGANAARGDWGGVAGPLAAMADAGCLR